MCAVPEIDSGLPNIFIYEIYIKDFNKSDLSWFFNMDFPNVAWKLTM